MSTPSSVLSAPTAVREGAFGNAVHLVCRECRATQPLAALLERLRAPVAACHGDAP